MSEITKSPATVEGAGDFVVADILMIHIAKDPN